jgi:hypothetical protein
MKPYLAPLAILLVTSFVVGGIAADGHSVPKPGWNKFVPIVEPLLHRALREHGDGSIGSTVKVSDRIEKLSSFT